MKSEITARERFRKNFVLAMTLVYVIAFIVLIGGFLEALLLAALTVGGKDMVLAGALVAGGWVELIGDERIMRIHRYHQQRRNRYEKTNKLCDCRG